MARSGPIQECDAFAAQPHSREARASVSRLGLASMSWSQLSGCPILLIFAEPSLMADDGSIARVSRRGNAEGASVQGDDTLQQGHAGPEN